MWGFLAYKRVTHALPEHEGFSPSLGGGRGSQQADTVGWAACGHASMMVSIRRETTEASQEHIHLQKASFYYEGRGGRLAETKDPVKLY